MWALAVEVPLTSRAARRLGRETAVQTFDPAAAALNEDWGTRLDGKQVRRWSEALGRRLVVERAAEVRAYEQGRRPGGPANEPALLVIGMDGGRVQMRAKNPETGRRWREDQVATIPSYLPGDGPEHPRRVLANNVAYFEKHRAHRDDPTYRRKGWPIGSGVTEAGVKQFNKRAKGTEPFWSPPGGEAIRARRSLWLSQDDRWSPYWTTRPAYLPAAQSVTHPGDLDGFIRTIRELGSYWFQRVTLPPC